MGRYRALTEIHGDRVYLPGDEMELDAGEAAHLLEGGDIELVAGDAPEAPAGGAPGPLAHLEPATVRRLADLDSDWIDRLITVADVLYADQVERLIGLEAGGVRALLDPPAPTMETAGARAMEALRKASPGQVQDFLKAIAADPDIATTMAGVQPAGDADPAEQELSREEKLVAACAGLDPKNPDHWLSDGTTPSIEALEAATGLEDVSAAERTAAHNEHVKREGEALTGG